MPIARAKSAKRVAVKISADRVAGGGAFVLDGDAVKQNDDPDCVKGNRDPVAQQQEGRTTY